MRYGRKHHGRARSILSCLEKCRLRSTQAIHCLLLPYRTEYCIEGYDQLVHIACVRQKANILTKFQCRNLMVVSISKPAIMSEIQQDAVNTAVAIFRVNKFDQPALQLHKSSS
jgi:hypothetical protein